MSLHLLGWAHVQLLACGCPVTRAGLHARGRVLLSFLTIVFAEPCLCHIPARHFPSTCGDSLYYMWVSVSFTLTAADQGPLLGVPTGPPAFPLPLRAWWGWVQIGRTSKPISLWRFTGHRERLGRQWSVYPRASHQCLVIAESDRGCQGPQRGGWSWGTLPAGWSAVPFGQPLALCMYPRLASPIGVPFSASNRGAE